MDSIYIDRLFLRTDQNLDDTPPDAPGDLTAVVQPSGEVRLTWSDNSDNELGFWILRSVNGIHFGEIGTAGMYDSAQAKPLVMLYILAQGQTSCIF